MKIADRNYRGFGVMGTLCTVPVLFVLQSTKSAFMAWLLHAAVWMIVAGYTSINAVVKAELFPTKGRASLVLLLPDAGHCRVAGRVGIDARHEASVCDGTS